MPEWNTRKIGIQSHFSTLSMRLLMIIDNWGGGYIIIGLEEENGMPKLPITGLEKCLSTELVKNC